MTGVAQRDLGNDNGALQEVAVVKTPRYVDVTLSLDTNAYADNDVLAATQVIADAFRFVDIGSVCKHILVLNEDDTAASEMDVIFLGADVALGTENAAVSITDANARNIQWIENIAEAAYVDLINSKVGVKAINSGNGVCLVPISGTKNLAVAVILRTDALTFTASGVRLRLCFED